jgi:hypothetical protein
MTKDPRFALHPLAAQDITEIWEYVARQMIRLPRERFERKSKLPFSP